MSPPKKYDVVISGIGGKFPECNSLNEFKEKLMDKEVLLKKDNRVDAVENKSQLLVGQIPDWNKFDCSFFGVSTKLARSWDPLMGLMLESSYEAMVDAGVNPYSLKGHNIGVISANSISEGELLHMTDNLHVDGLGMVGHSRTMMANRISYCFDFNGPSYSCDTYWLSSMQSLQMAAELVSQGAVEAVIVTTANIMKSEIVDQEYKILNILSDSGNCYPFDARAQGISRSEGSLSFFIQRAQDAKRIYSSILKVENCHFGSKECSFMKIGSFIKEFVSDFYTECDVNPLNVSYVEASGWGIQHYDSEELIALSKIFCDQKARSLLIGSLSGNLGTTENASGLVSLSKAIIAMDSGIIPPTVNYETPNCQVSALKDGSLKPVTECTELEGDLVAVNCLSHCGAIGHALLRRHNKTKTKEQDNLPRLVMLQARNEEGAKTILDKVNSMPFDSEFVSLVNDVFKTPVPAYLWRAYTIVPHNKSKASFNIQEFNSARRPVWWCFSGMGSQWAGMGKDLLSIPIFAASIDKCDEVLRPLGVDIKHIITTHDSSIFDNILICFVGIAAIQIGLVDILRAVGVTPDGIIGHSVGELGCAYADGCFSAQEMILAAYARGKASLDSEVIPGMMAAVGLGYNTIKDEIPESIDIACHNASDSCTLSGPTDEVIKYVQELKDKNVFAKAVSAGGIAYHSRYIKPIGPKLLKNLKELITEPKPRSPRWISSSVPEEKWGSAEAMFCSAEYHTNNLLNPVLFEEACKYIPQNAIVIEIAPRGLLQAILRRSLSSENINLSLTNTNNESNVRSVLDGLGKLFLNNVAVDVKALYPEVQYPVSRSTPSLTDLVTWDHTETWFSDFISSIRMVGIGIQTATVLQI